MGRSKLILFLCVYFYTEVFSFPNLGIVKPNLNEIEISIQQKLNKYLPEIEAKNRVVKQIFSRSKRDADTSIVDAITEVGESVQNAKPALEPEADRPKRTLELDPSLFSKSQGPDEIIDSFDVEKYLQSKPDLHKVFSTTNPSTVVVTDKAAPCDAEHHEPKVKQPILVIPRPVIVEHYEQPILVVHRSLPVVNDVFDEPTVVETEIQQVIVEQVPAPLEPHRIAKRSPQFYTSTQNCNCGSTPCRCGADSTFHQSQAFILAKSCDCGSTPCSCGANPIFHQSQGLTPAKSCNCGSATCRCGANPTLHQSELSIPTKKCNCGSGVCSCGANPTFYQPELSIPAKTCNCGRTSCSCGDNPTFLQSQDSIPAQRCSCGCGCTGSCSGNDIKFYKSPPNPVFDSSYFEIIIPEAYPNRLVKRDAPYENFRPAEANENDHDLAESFQKNIPIAPMGLNKSTDFFRNIGDDSTHDSDNNVLIDISNNPLTHNQPKSPVLSSPQSQSQYPYFELGQTSSNLATPATTPYSSNTMSSFSASSYTPWPSQPYFYNSASPGRNTITYSSYIQSGKLKIKEEKPEEKIPEEKWQQETTDPQEETVDLHDEEPLIDDLREYSTDFDDSDTEPQKRSFKLKDRSRNGLASRLSAKKLMKEEPAVVPAPEIVPGYAPAPAFVSEYAPVPTVVPEYVAAPAIVPAYAPASTIVPEYSPAPAIIPEYVQAPAIISTPAIVPEYTQAPEFISAPVTVPEYTQAPAIISAPATVPEYTQASGIISAPATVPEYAQAPAIISAPAYTPAYVSAPEYASAPANVPVPSNVPEDATQIKSHSAPRHEIVQPIPTAYVPATPDTSLMGNSIVSESVIQTGYAPEFGMESTIQTAPERITTVTFQPYAQKITRPRTTIDYAEAAPRMTLRIPQSMQVKSMSPYESIPSPVQSFAVSKPVGPIQLDEGSFAIESAKACVTEALVDEILPPNTKRQALNEEVYDEPQVITPQAAISQITAHEATISPVATAQAPFPLVVVPLDATPITIPSVATSETNIPLVATPEAVIPLVATPEAVIPLVATPEAVIPLVATPEAVVPLITTPEAVVSPVANHEVAIAPVSTPEIATPLVTSSIQNIGSNSIEKSERLTPESKSEEVTRGLDTVMRLEDSKPISWVETEPVVEIVSSASQIAPKLLEKLQRMKEGKLGTMGKQSHRANSQSEPSRFRNSRIEKEEEDDFADNQIYGSNFSIERKKKRLSRSRASLL